MSVGQEVHNSLQSPRLERLRGELRDSSWLRFAAPALVGGGYLTIALLDGGTDPGVRAGAAIVLWVLVILGLALGIWPRSPTPRPALLAGVLLGVLAALAALSVAWASDQAQAVNEVVRILAYLGLFVTVVLSSSRGGGRDWLIGLALALGVVALLALISRTQPGLIGAAEAIRADLPPARVNLAWPTAYWNALGTAMAVAVLLFGWAAADLRVRAARAVATGAIPIAVLVLFLTYSRAAIIALGVGLIVLIAVRRERPALAGSLALGGTGGLLLIALALVGSPEIYNGALELPRAGREGDLLLMATAVVTAGVGLARHVAERPLAAIRVSRRTGRRIAIVGAVVGLVALLSINPVARAERFCDPPNIGPESRGGTVTGHLASASGGGRCQYWEVGLEAFASAPLFGVGAGSYQSWWGENHAFPRPVTFAHSLPITSLAELGLVGLLLVGGFFAVVALAGLRVVRSEGEHGALLAVSLAVLTTVAITATVDWIWEHPAGIAPAIIAAALLTGPAVSRVSDDGRGRFGYGVGALVAGWLTIVLASLGLFGQVFINDSRDALEAGRLADALQAADTAATLQPWASEPYLLKAAVLEGRGNLRNATGAVEDALARSPGDWRVWAVAGRVRAQSGHPFAALDDLDRANALNPVIRSLGTGGGLVSE